MTTLNLDCGSQDNLLSKSLMKNGAEQVPFFLKNLHRDQEGEIREYLERRLNAKQIAHKMMLRQDTVDKYLSTLRRVP